MFRLRLFRLQCLAALTVLLACLLSWAQGNPRDSSLGGRTLLTGNTGVALGRDGASPFLNPATIITIEDRRLALSVNAYQYRWVRARNWFQPGEVQPELFGDVELPERDFTEHDFDSLPSTFCLFFTLQRALGKQNYRRYLRGVLGEPGRQKLAICGATIERQEFGFTVANARSTDNNAAVSLAQSTRRSFQRFALGPAFSYQLTNSWTLGGSLYGVLSQLRHNSTVNGLAAGATTPHSIRYAEHTRGTSIDLMALLGATFRAAPMTWGLSAQLPSTHIWGTLRNSRVDQTRSVDGDIESLQTSDGSFEAPPLTRISLGVGWEGERTTLELDLHTNPPLSGAVSSELSLRRSTMSAGQLTEARGTAEIREDSDWGFGVGLGGERFLSEDFSLLAGAFGETSVFDQLSTTERTLRLVQDRSHRLGISAGVGSYGTNTELLIGLQSAYLFGEMSAPNVFVSPTRIESVAHQSLRIMLVLAGSVSLQNLQRVVDAPGKVFEPRQDR